MEFSLFCKFRTFRTRFPVQSVNLQLDAPHPAINADASRANWIKKGPEQCPGLPTQIAH